MAGQVAVGEAQDAWTTQAARKVKGDRMGTIAGRYSWRWPTEPSNATGKQILGAGDACNRVEKAVERTVPSGFLVQSLLICWYARCAYDPADIDRRRRRMPVVPH